MRWHLERLVSKSRSIRSALLPGECWTKAMSNWLPTVFRKLLCPAAARKLPLLTHTSFADEVTELPPARQMPNKYPTAPGAEVKLPAGHTGREASEINCHAPADAIVHSLVKTCVCVG